MKTALYAFASLGFFMISVVPAHSEWRNCDWRKSCVVQALDTAYKNDPISMFELRRTQGKSPVELFQELRAELLGLPAANASKFLEYAVNLEDKDLIATIVLDAQFSERARNEESAFGLKFGSVIQKHIELTGDFGKFREFVLFNALRWLRGKTWSDIEDDDLEDVVQEVVDLGGFSSSVFASRIARVGAWDQFAEWFHNSDIDWASPALAAADREDFARASFLLALAPERTRDVNIELAAKKVLESRGHLVCFEENEYQNFQDDGVWPDFKVARASCPELAIRPTKGIVTTLDALALVYKAAGSDDARSRTRSLMFEALREYGKGESELRIAVDKIMETVPEVSHQLRQVIADHDIDQTVKNFLTLRISTSLRETTVIQKIRDAQKDLTDQRQINGLGNMLLGDPYAAAGVTPEADAAFLEAVLAEHSYSPVFLGDSLGFRVWQAVRRGQTALALSITDLSRKHGADFSGFAVPTGIDALLRETNNPVVQNFALSWIIDENGTYNGQKEITESFVHSALPTMWRLGMCKQLWTFAKNGMVSDTMAKVDHRGVRNGVLLELMAHQETGCWR